MQILNQSTNSFAPLPLGNSEGKVGALPKKIKSERAELIKYFVENLKDKKNKPYKPARIAMLLAHLSTKDLYYQISVCKDIMNRRGQEAFQKYFWWSLKSK